MHDMTENSLLTMQEKPPRQSTTIIAGGVLIFLTLLAIFGSVTLMLYATNVRPTELNIQATAVVNALLTHQAQATATNSPQLVYSRLTNKLPSINAPLDLPGGGWIIGKKGNSSCAFTNGSYDIHVGTDEQLFLCRDKGNYISDFVFQVQMTIMHSSSIGGILFRGTPQQVNGYLFGITSNKLYTISTITNNMTNGSNLAFGRSTAVFSGLNQSNTLTVIAQGKHLSFYINQQFVTSTIDNTFSAGIIGLFASRAQGHTAADVTFNNAQLWVL